MFVFLQSWRAVLIPAIAVPVVLLGTFGIFYLLGFSINTLTLFGLTLAIGLLVDDAIVVVENVERLMEENPGMTAREATIQSMRELQVALIAIALVLRSEEHTSELQSLMRISYAVFCLKKKKDNSKIRLN